MDRLKGKTILLGKEPAQGRLLVAIVGGKTAAIGSPNTVPNSVSRCKVAEGVAHAKITVDQNGNMILTNMKPQNVTFVNGAGIVSKRIDQNNTVELGKDHYAVNVQMVLEVAKRLVGVLPPPPQTPLDISHLEHIWNEYHDKILERQRKQKKLGIIASCSMFFTIGGSAIAAIANKLQWGKADDYLWILPVIGFIVFFISIYLRIKDTSIEDTDMAQNELQQKYILPCCNHFCGSIPYELLKNQLFKPAENKMKCPKCGHELMERK